MSVITPLDPGALPRRVLVEFSQGSAVIRKSGVLERVEQPAPVAWVRMDDGPTEFVALERVLVWEGGEGGGGEPGDGYGGGEADVVFSSSEAEPGGGGLPPGVAKLARSMPAGDCK